MSTLTRSPTSAVVNETFVAGVLATVFVAAAARPTWRVNDLCGGTTSRGYSSWS